jgi:RNA polymerase sigma-70 factor (ECF subfamily)
MDSGDDVELVGRCLRGDVEAFAPLVARYQKVLFNVALRLLGDREDARDVTQTAFVRAFEKLSTYDPAHRFFSWVYRIAVNECLNLRHRRPIHQRLDEALPSTDSPLVEAEAREMAERVQAGLLKLSPEHREVVVLRHFAELSYSDIAAALGLPEKTVKSRLYTARQRLGQILLAEDGKR